MKVYTFNQFDHELRVAEINGEPWFVAKDVCASLGIVWRGSSTTLSQIPDNWQGVQNFSTPGGTQQLRVISEAGLYKLAFRCQSSEIADRFTNKVASEILPSIRKTGKYEAKPARPSCRGPRRATGADLMNTEILNLLWLIDESLHRGDRQAVALEMGVSRVTVHKVLSGQVRNAHILMALYQRAKANRSRGMLYYKPALMTARLTDEDPASAERALECALPPVVYRECSSLDQSFPLKRKRGGQPGNQNAGKYRGKEHK